MEKNAELLFNDFKEVRYLAIYKDNVLFTRQRGQLQDSSSADTDRFEELLVNPTLLTLARQRGNIDCGGLRYMIIGYGNFFQLIGEVTGGHVSVCLDKDSIPTTLAVPILNRLCLI